MPIPRAYETLADSMESRLRLILGIGVGGSIALLAIGGLAAGLRLTVPPVLYELLRIGAHAVAVTWILGMIALFFHSRWGFLQRMRRRPGRALGMLSWLLSWLGALLIDFGVVAIAISLVLT